VLAKIIAKSSILHVFKGYGSVFGVIAKVLDITLAVSKNLVNFSFHANVSAAEFCVIARPRRFDHTIG
jgi:hypothetical protein